MQVTSNGRSIQEILTAGFYRVPRFQRPYSWDKSNVEDLWADMTASEGRYFIGSMVTYPVMGDSGLVDGQQRLTTVTILLAALRNKLLKLEAEKEARGVQTMIERIDPQGETRFVLITETSYPYLQSRVQAQCHVA